jgi:NADP-dependent 3-hydroxy acid dehydrogenase YdfG
MSSLSGNTVVIIGGSSGIGLETARQAHAAGAKLILTGRDQGRLEAARDELGASAATLAVSGGHRDRAHLPPVIRAGSRPTSTQACPSGTDQPGA